MIESLSTITAQEAATYMREACDDEIAAAYQLACDRNRLDGSDTLPDDTEVHHALFMLRHVNGGSAPSFDGLRAQLRERTKTASRGSRTSPEAPQSGVVLVGSRRRSRAAA